MKAPEWALVAPNTPGKKQDRSGSLDRDDFGWDQFKIMTAISFNT
jgi:hypothetical protein